MESQYEMEEEVPGARKGCNHGNINKTTTVSCPRKGYSHKNVNETDLINTIDHVHVNEMACEDTIQTCLDSMHDKNRESDNYIDAKSRVDKTEIVERSKPVHIYDYISEEQLNQIIDNENSTNLTNVSENDPCACKDCVDLKTLLIGFISGVFITMAAIVPAVNFSCHK